MARPMRGSVTTHKGKDGHTYRYLRFTAYGKRRNVPVGAISVGEAERELAHVIADVERGVWQPERVDAPSEPAPIPTFHEFAEEWWTLKSGDLKPSTRADYSWRLQVHLLKWFGEMRLDAITFDTVE